MRRPLLWVPLAGFVLLLLVVATGLFRPADRAVRSTLIDRPLPDFALKPVVPGKPGLAKGDFTGRPRLLNVFASWCVPCIAEAPQLLALKRAGVPIEAIAIRDTGADVQAFLRRNGDPYERIGDDPASATQLALGSSGVPETFLVDAEGVIRRQYIGDIHADQVAEIVAAVEAAR